MSDKIKKLEEDIAILMDRTKYLEDCLNSKQGFTRKDLAALEEKINIRVSLALGLNKSRIDNIQIANDNKTLIVIKQITDRYNNLNSKFSDLKRFNYRLMKFIKGEKAL